jgi:hypothetical protein
LGELPVPLGTLLRVPGEVKVVVVYVVEAETVVVPINPPKELSKSTGNGN